MDSGVPALPAKKSKYYPTQLETFVACPFKYRCSQDPETRDKYRQPTPQLYVGMCVHDALEAFFDIKRVPVAQRTREKLGDLLRRSWAGVDLWKKRREAREEERRRVFGDDRELEVSWGRHALNILDRYYLITDRTAVPFTAEQFHEAKLRSGIVLAGKIDRIDRDDDGSLRIMDYKTGKPPFKKDDESVAEEDLQLSAYAIVVRKKYRVPISRCSLIFVAHDEEVGFTPTDQFLAGKAARIEEIVKEIEAEEVFPPKENQFCSWCEYREICAVGKEIPAAAATPEQPHVPF